MELNPIVDPSVKQRLESVRLSPNRKFACDPCQRVCDRNGVNKKRDGTYSCLICGKPVRLVEGSELGRDLVAIGG